MKEKEKKKLLTLLGFTSLVIGIMGGVPSFLKESYLGLTTTAIFILLGLILLVWGQS